MERRLPRGGLAVLTVTSLNSFIAPFLGAAVSIALPAIGGEFSMGAVALAWVNTAFLLSASMLLLPFGRLADLFGRRRIFLAGTWVGLFTSLLAALAPHAGWLLFARVLQGVGGAMVLSTSMALLTQAFPPKERGRVLGINVTSVYLGLTLGPVLGGFLVHAAGWRAVMGLNVPLALVILVIATRNLPLDRDLPGGRVDVAGSSLFSAALGCLVFGFSTANSLTGWALIAGGVTAFLLFGMWEFRTSQPMLDLRLFFSNRAFLFSNLAALINYSSTTAVVFLLSLYLQSVRGLSPAQAGLVLLVQPLLMAALAAFAGALSDRVEPRLLASAGMAVTVIGLIPLALLGPSTPIPWIMADLALLGVGFGFFSSPNTNAVMGSVARRHLGVASAAIGTMRMTGQVLSMGLASLILSLVMGQAPIVPGSHPLFLRSLHLSAGLFAALCFAGIWISLARNPGTAPAKSPSVPFHPSRIK